MNETFSVIREKESGNLNQFDSVTSRIRNNAAGIISAKVTSKGQKLLVFDTPDTSPVPV